MSKVTYLFGAGASALCLPVVEDIPARLEEFRNHMAHNKIEPTEFISSQSRVSYSEVEDLFQKECTDLIQNVKDHASIDTYAKKLFISNQKDTYIFLKSILTIFFTYTQLTKPPDKRYDSFFASILKNNSTEFNNDIRIVSWNYDFQFEMAYSQYSRKTDFHENQIALNLYPDGIRPSKYKDGFSIFKINGTTSIYDIANRETVNLFKTLHVDDEVNLRKRLLYFFLSMSTNKGFKPLLSFGWENTNENHEELNKVTYNSINGCENLVIIGYSFPFFNREIDRQIFASISNGNPMKIYVQDLKPQNIIDKLDSVLPSEKRNHTFIPISSVDQFFLPHEL